jgi:hypothetical protein
MILGINWGRSFMVPEFGAGSSPRRMASSRPVATRRPNKVQTLCTAKPRTTTVTRMNMVTPLRMVIACLRPPILGGSQRGPGPEVRASRAQIRGDEVLYGEPSTRKKMSSCFEPGTEWERKRRKSKRKALQAPKPRALAGGSASRRQSRLAHGLFRPGSWSNSGHDPSRPSLQPIHA